MSLINDALKRAQAEKLREGQSSAPVPPLQPVTDAPTATSKVLPWASLFLGLGVIGIAAALWFNRSEPAQQLARTQTPAATQSQPVAPEQSASVQPAPTVAANIPAETSATVPVSQERATANVVSAPVAPDASSGKTGAAEIPAASAPVLAANSSTPITESPAAPVAAPSSVEPARETKAAAAVPATVEPAATVPPVTAPATEQRPPQLQAIYYRLRGPTVVINGKTLRVGQSVDDVKVVSIQRTSVEVVQDGKYQTLTLND